MAVFEGVLDSMSGGSTIFQTGNDPRMTGGERISQMATQGANLTHREFIVIDGKRLMNVNMSNRHDALLESSVGQRVRISAVQSKRGYMIMGVKLSDGTVDKNGVWMTTLVQSANIFVPVAFLAIVGFVLFLVGNPIVAILVWALAAIFVRGVVMGTRSMLKARAEL